MKKQILFFASIGILILHFTNMLHAQPSTFSKIYGNSIGVPNNSIVKTFDNTFIIAGEEDNVALVFKIDSTGSILWGKNFGSHSNESFNSIITTRDSCYVIAGKIFNTVDSTSDIFCVKINSNGDTIWTKEIDMGNDDYALSVQQTFDNGFILAGNSDQYSTAQYRPAVVKLDANGNLMWGNTYSIPNFNIYANSVKQIPDSGYVVIGYLDSLPTYDRRTFLIKLNTAGNISWTKKQMAPSNYSSGLDVITTTDGLICYLGTDNNYCTIMKTDFSGNVIWSKKYNVNISFLGNSGLKLQNISNNEYIFNSGFALTKIDTAGIPLWTKYGSPVTINDFIQNQDKGFIIIGIPGIIVKTFGYINILKTDSSGQTGVSPCQLSNYISTYSSFSINLDSVTSTSAPTAVAVPSHPIIANATLTILGNGCVIGGIKESKDDKIALQVFPNPATDNISIEILQNATLDIIDIQGRLILKQPLQQGKTDINISGLAQGIYILKLSNENTTETTRFIKE